jgi:hypothetical protein
LNSTGEATSFYLWVQKGKIHAILIQGEREKEERREFSKIKFSKRKVRMNKEEEKGG